MVLNTWKLATHKIEYNTIWRPIYDQNTTVTEVLATQKLVPATQKWVATHLLRTTDLNDRRSLLFSVSHKFAERTFSPCDAYMKL